MIEEFQSEVCFEWAREILDMSVPDVGFNFKPKGLALVTPIYQVSMSFVNPWIQTPRRVQILTPPLSGIESIIIIGFRS